MTSSKDNAELPECAHCGSHQTIMVERYGPKLYAAALICTLCEAHGPLAEAASVDAVSKLAVKEYIHPSVRGRKYKQPSGRDY